MLAGELELRLIADVARLRADMDRMTGIVEKNSKQMESAFNRVGSAIKGLVAGLSVAAVAAMVRNMVNMVDALNDVKDATGASIEAISGLENIARRTGSNLDTVSTTLLKLNQALGQTLKPGSDAEKVIKAIGLNAKDLRDLDPAEALLKTAVALNQFADDGKKAVATQLLFGRSLKEIAPLLKDVAEAGELVATVTTRQADEADKFNKQLSRMTANVGDLGRAMVGEILPPLNTLGDLLAAAGSDGDSLAKTLGGGVKTALQTVAVLGLEVAFVFKGIGREIGGIAAQIVALATLDFKAFSAISEEMRADAIKARRENDAAIARIMGTDLMDVEAGDAMSRRLRRAPPLKSVGDLGGGGGSSAAANALNKELEDQTKLLAELSGLSGSFAEDWARLNRLFASGKINVEQLTKAQADLLAKQPAIKQQADAVAAAEKEAMKIAQERQKLRQDEADGIKAFMDAESDRLAQTVKGARDTLQSAQDELANRGKLKSEIEETTIARLEEKLVAHTAGSEAFKALEDEIRLRKELRGTLRSIELSEANDRAAQAARDQWQSVADAFVDNLMRGGKSVAQYLKDLFRTLVLRPILAPIGQAVAGVVGSAFGLPAMAQSAVGSAAGSSFLTGAAGATASSWLGAGFGATLQNGIFSGFANNMANIGTLVSGGAYGTAISAALPYVGLGLAVLSMVGAFKKGETRVGGQYDLTNLVDSPSGGAIEDQTVRKSIASTIDTINKTLQALGSSSQVSGFASGLEQSTKGKGFAYARGTLTTGGVFGDWSLPGYMQNRGNMTAQEALAAYTTELKQATLSALQAAIDLPKSISMMLEGVDINALGDADLQAILKRIGDLATAVEGFRQVVDMLPFETLRDRSFDSAAGLIKLAGGLDQLTAGLNAYYENFFNEEEKRINTANAISRRLAEGGLIFSGDDILRITQMANARQIFRDYTDAFMAMGEGGDTAVAALLAVAGAFAQLTPAAEEAKGALLDLASLQRDVDAAYMRVFEMRKDELTTLKETARRYSELAVSLRSFRDSLLVGDLSPLTPAQKYAQTSSLFQSTYTAALGGDTEAQSRLQAVSRDFLTASRDFFASSEQYQSDFARVQSALTISIAKATEEAAWAAEQAGILEEQLTALGIINSSVQTVSQAIQELARAISAVIAAGGNPGAGPIGTLTGGVTGQFVETPIGPVYSSTAGAAVTGGKLYAINGGVYTQPQAQSIINEMITQGRTKQAYDAFKAAGVTLAEANIIMGWPSDTAQSWARAVGLPVFHGGTDYVPRTGLAMLEQGERVVPRSLNDGMARDPRAVRRLLESLVEEVKQLRGEHRTGVNSRNDVTIAAAERTGEIVVQGTASYRSRASFEADNERKARTLA